MSEAAMKSYRNDYVVTNIQWDTDGHSLNECGLPESVLYLGMPVQSEDFDDVDERISVDLSDRFGFCHDGFKLDTLDNCESLVKLGSAAVVRVQAEEEVYAGCPDYEIYLSNEDVDVDLIFESGQVITLQHRPTNKDGEYKGSFDVILPDDTIVNTYTGDLAPSVAIESSGSARICNQLVMEIP